MWAIKIPFDESFLYLIEADDPYNYNVRKFETKKEAIELAKIWRNAEVVPFPKEEI